MCVICVDRLRKSTTGPAAAQCPFCNKTGIPFRAYAGDVLETMGDSGLRVAVDPLLQEQELVCCHVVSKLLCTWPRIGKSVTDAVMKYAAKLPRVVMTDKKTAGAESYCAARAEEWFLQQEIVSSESAARYFIAALSANLPRVAASASVCAFVFPIDHARIIFADDPFPRPLCFALFRGLLTTLRRCQNTVGSTDELRVTCRGVARLLSGTWSVRVVYDVRLVQALVQALCGIIDRNEPVEKDADAAVPRAVLIDVAASLRSLVLRLGRKSLKNLHVVFGAKEKLICEKAVAYYFSSDDDAALATVVWVLANTRATIGAADCCEACGVVKQVLTQVLDSLQTLALFDAIAQAKTPPCPSVSSSELAVGEVLRLIDTAERILLNSEKHQEEYDVSLCKQLAVNSSMRLLRTHLSRDVFGMVINQMATIICSSTALVSMVETNTLVLCMRDCMACKDHLRDTVPIFTRAVSSYTAGLSSFCFDEVHIAATVVRHVMQKRHITDAPEVFNAFAKLLLIDALPIDTAHIAIDVVYMSIVPCIRNNAIADDQLVLLLPPLIDKQRALFDVTRVPNATMVNFCIRATLDLVLDTCPMLVRDKAGMDRVMDFITTCCGETACAEVSMWAMQLTRKAIAQSKALSRGGNGAPHFFLLQDTFDRCLSTVLKKTTEKPPAMQQMIIARPTAASAHNAETK